MSHICVGVRGSWRVCLDREGYVVEEYAGRRRQVRRRLAKAIPYYGFGKYCRKCAHPLPRRWNKCLAHDDGLEHLDATLAVGLYYTQRVQEQLKWLGLHQNLLTSYILELKQRRRAFQVLAASMALILKAKVYEIEPKDIDIITFVPKHKDELKVDIEDSEHYNQAELLANEVARYLEKRLVNVIYKTQPLSLAGRSIQERYQKSYQVYKLQENAEHVIRDKRVLLVDDVRTSGATGNVIARLLKQAGAKNVYLLVAGRATHYETLKEILEEYGDNPEFQEY
ncbi:MAG: hypothetical protein DSY37_04605 [Hyperthermus sp.]|nr:MAG: hypothetical protein DSY37_04605 [Hyperthermus sp.]